MTHTTPIVGEPRRRLRCVRRRPRTRRLSPALRRLSRLLRQRPRVRSIAVQVHFTQVLWTQIHCIQKGHSRVPEPSATAARSSDASSAATPRAGGQKPAPSPGPAGYGSSNGRQQSRSNDEIRLRLDKSAEAPAPAASAVAQRTVEDHQHTYSTPRRRSYRWRSRCASVVASVPRPRKAGIGASLRAPRSPRRALGGSPPRRAVAAAASNNSPATYICSGASIPSRCNPEASTRAVTSLNARRLARVLASGARRTGQCS